jgi:hypothetical protein
MIAASSGGPVRRASAKRERAWAYRSWNSLELARASGLVRPDGAEQHRAALPGEQAGLVGGTQLQQPVDVPLAASEALHVIRIQPGKDVLTQQGMDRQPRLRQRRLGRLHGCRRGGQDQ